MRLRGLVVSAVLLGSCSVQVTAETRVVRLDSPVQVGELECTVDGVLREIAGHADGVVGEITAEAAVSAYQAEHPARFDALALDRNRSTDTRWVFVDGQGRAQLVLDVRQVIDRTWVVGGSEACAEE